MNQQAYGPTQRYREVQVKTAAKDDLLILLLDGGVRFAEGAVLELQKGKDEDRDRRNDHLQRAQKIVLELVSSLSPAIGLDLYEKLQGLYRFTFERFFEGNLRSDLALVEEGVVMMKSIRDMWREAVAKAKSERNGPLTPPAANSSISVTG